MEALDQAVEVIEAQLKETFTAFMGAFGAAQEAGLDAQAIIAANLREAVGEQNWASLPLSVKMLLG